MKHTHRNITLALIAGMALTHAALAADLILNEWNCVGSQKWLDNPDGPTSGCANPDGPDGFGCSDGYDAFFGRVLGNGGDWIELVVTRDHTDIRGWMIQWIETGASDSNGQDIWYGSSNVPQGQITFSNSPVWANLRAGTVITITENSTAQGGLDSDTTFDPCNGDWWINANCFDASLLTCVANVVDPTNPGYIDPLDVGNDNWAARILNAAGVVQQGLTGEGQSSWGASGVNSKEAVRLEQDPSTSITAFSPYDDANNSSFGQPNNWSDNVTDCRKVQNMAALRNPVIAELCTACNPVILNEYNAVSPAKFLGGGTQGADASGGQAADGYFGRVAGNGGNWFELVVIANGLDLRSAALQWSDDDASGEIRLSNSAFWGNLQAGMIITFIEQTTAGGGLDTDLSFSPGSGDRWVNINTFDATLVASTTSTKPGHVSGEFSTSNDEWSIAVLDSHGSVLMAPSGEGSAFFLGGGVGSENVCRLRENIARNITAASHYDDDGKASTFGAPNKWTLCPAGTTVVQSFAALPFVSCEWAPANPADITGDGVVNGADLGALLAGWNLPGVTDIDGDGTTNGADLGMLLSSWSN